MADENITHQFYMALLKAGNAKQIPDAPPASVNYNLDLHNKKITGNFSLSLSESFDDTTGDIRLSIANSLTDKIDETQSPQVESPST